MMSDKVVTDFFLRVRMFRGPMVSKPTVGSNVVNFPQGLFRH